MKIIGINICVSSILIGIDTYNKLADSFLLRIKKNQNHEDSIAVSSLFTFFSGVVVEKENIK